MNPERLYCVGGHGGLAAFTRKAMSKNEKGSSLFGKKRPCEAMLHAVHNELQQHQLELTRDRAAPSEQQRDEVAAFLQERHVSQGPFPLNTQHSNPHTPVFDTGQNPTFPTVYPLPPTHRPPTRLRFRPLMQTQARMQARARGHRLQERLHLSPPGR